MPCTSLRATRSFLAACCSGHTDQCRDKDSYPLAVSALGTSHIAQKNFPTSCTSAIEEGKGGRASPPRSCSQRKKSASRHPAQDGGPQMRNGCAFAWSCSRQPDPKTDNLSYLMISTVIGNHHLSLTLDCSMNCSKSRMSRHCRLPILT